MNELLLRRRVAAIEPILTDKSYIQDGLIFQLDGINKGSNVNAWTDLVGGIPFVYNQAATIKQNSVSLDGTNYLRPSTERTISTSYLTSTIEVCANQGSNYGGVFISGTNNSICFIRKSNGLTTGLSTNNSRKRLTASGAIPNTVYTASVNVNTFYIVNGISKSLSTTNEWVKSTAKYASIGGNGVGFMGAMEIYAVRVYNRILTTDEVLYNQNIDNERFNLGLTI